MTLLMREQEIARDNFEKGMLEGIAKGINEGVIKGREEGMAQGVIKGREEGIAQGVIKGREEGIKNLVDTCIELGMDKEFIVKKLVEKYKLSEEEARGYLEK